MREGVGGAIFHPPVTENGVNSVAREGITTTPPRPPPHFFHLTEGGGGELNCPLEQLVADTPHCAGGELSVYNGIKVVPGYCEIFVLQKIHEEFLVFFFYLFGQGDGEYALFVHWRFLRRALRETREP